MWLAANFLTLEGRLGRAGFALGVLLLVVVGVLAGIVIHFVQLAAEAKTPTPLFYDGPVSPAELLSQSQRTVRAVLVSLLLAWPTVSLTARRLRDMGLPAWLAVLSVVPLPYVPLGPCVLCAVIPGHEERAGWA
ncbi:MAG: DUF805 domain-containing protein [Microvirga sp.]